MNILEIMASSHRILDELNNQTDSVLARAELSTQQSFRGMSSYLAHQASLAEDDEDLLHIADILHDLASEVPGMLENGYKPGKFQEESLEPVLDPTTMHSFVQSEKECLQKSLDQAFEKLKQRVPVPSPKVVRLTKNPQPWKWAGAFKDDPMWDEVMEEIERQRDLDWIGGEE